MKKLLIVGGDRRFRILKEQLEKEGFPTETLGLYENDSGSIENAEIIILPVPTTRDKTNINAPLTGRAIPLSLLEKSTRKEQLILTCGRNFPERQCIDYGQLDGYALLNAIPTAEGAIKIAIESTPYMLFESRILVIGFGRVGKILADRLKGLGCQVTVSARKEADFALCRALGYGTVNTNTLNTASLCYNIIFNTVDAEVLSEAALKQCKCDLLIELSSLGGFSFDTANKYGITAIKAPSLPALYAPQTAAEILAETIINIIRSHNGGI